jgi:hypothetical protein
MKLYRMANGKKELIAEGDRKRLQRRLAELRRSTRGGANSLGFGGRKYKVTYTLED